jgi:cyclopropane-fatty-acyl-phospholipid synthase
MAATGRWEVRLRSRDARPESTSPASRQDGASSDAIQHHYDVGDDFYRLWLDPGMNYSSALFEADDSLEAAQVRKLDYHIEQAQAPHSARVLDVGCGWGSMLQRLVLEHGVESATGLTLSDAQYQKIQADAVPGVTVRLESWQEHKPETPYNAIISVGAFEHFVRPELTPREKIAAYREFFRFCHASLQPTRRLSLQCICYGTLRAGQINPFIAEMIFPESDLPYPWEVLEAADGLFEVVQLRNDRTHYRRTCREWYRNLEARREQAVALLGEAKVEHYERYLRIAIASFATRALGLLRVTFERLGR